MNSQNDNFERYYGQFGADHANQRQRLMDQLPAQPRLRRRYIPWLVSTAISGIAAAIVIWLFLPSNASLSWADVARHLRQVQTFSCRTTQQINNSEAAITSFTYFRAPDQIRSEECLRGDATSRPSDVTVSQPMLINATGHPDTIFAVSTGVYSVSQQVIFDPADVVSPSQMDWLTHLRDLDSAHIVRKGEEIVNGRRLIRFEEPVYISGLKTQEGSMNIWVDPATSLPVRVAAAGVTPGGAVFGLELDDLRFDPPLADSLFTWPDTGKNRMKERVIIYAPKALAPDQVRLSVTESDGTSLLTPNDFTPPQWTLIDQHGRRRVLELTPPALARLRDFSAAHIGQTLTFNMNGAGSKDVTIIGPIDYVSLALPPSAPTTQP